MQPRRTPLCQPGTRALWLVALALLLKSAMPWLASAAAERRGVAMVEVCTVYGVSTAAATAGRHGGAPPADGATALHGDDHCALAALLVVAGGGTSTDALAPAVAGHAVFQAPAWPRAPADAFARWAARLHHGPPRDT